MKTLNNLLIDAIKSNSSKVATKEYTSMNPASEIALTYKDIELRVARLQHELLARLESITLRESATVGIVCRNGADWIVADLGCLFSGLASLPLPHAFSRSQAHHLASKCDVFICDQTGEETLKEKWGLEYDEQRCIRLDETLCSYLEGATLLDLATAAQPSVCKIIHTSGTTSRPKGVQLTPQAIVETYKSLSTSIPKESQKTYLSLVPLSLLLEQVTAIYLPLMNGGTVSFLPQDLPLIGENHCDIGKIVEWITFVQPTAMTAPPVMIEALLNGIKQGDDALCQYLQDVPHITCGGARVDVETLEQLRSFGVEAYQGYGLSENASVVSVNTTQFNRLGSVGRPLPHVEVRIAQDGSIEIRSSSLFSGYSGHDPSACYVDEEGWLNTGDIGYLDEENYLYISGRKKNIICLPNGRNVYPEKIESEFQKKEGIVSAVLFLDEKKGTVILLKVDRNTFDQNKVEHWMHKEFSDIERPENVWVVDLHDDDIEALFTVTDRPKREEIKKRFQRI
ncbi:AMP-binding protein [Vibrio ostreicida]|uniref:AMP-binding protein n=1 Tax=Vibrio ostreicida TaxID=526588 RepID=A0ABT8BN12_9VIBR|nr:AMP-binding protein [Vibrio ostreicida]MDN3608531.1 AMP-binding protein [Vibrio ostreicida]NPD10664.1 AMP-binding protein [Vibrio ostreicida]